MSCGELELTACSECGFVFNSGFDGSKLSYGADYDNIQSHSPYFSRYMEGLAKQLLDEDGVRNCRIVEVGCGKGEFLRLLVTDQAYGNTGIGFDPSYVGVDSELDGRLRYERRYYDESCADVPADIIICRHVIEHVSDPIELLCTVRKALQNTVSPRIYFETPCVEWILKNKVIWDFFYEHCSLFTASSLCTAFQQAGFTVDRVRHVFGCQYLWLEARLDKKPSQLPMAPGNIPRLAKEYSVEEQRLRDDWGARLKMLCKQGKVAIWGAGAKGTTFAHLVDPECRYIECLVDLNPGKQGKYVPGTGHPIVGVEGLVEHNVSFAILMNPNYREENESLLAAAGISIQLIE